MADEPVDPPSDVTADPKLPEPVDAKGVVVGFPDGKRQVTIPDHLAKPEKALTSKLGPMELRVRRHERRRLAYTLWTQEWNFRDIGRALGVSGKTAFYYVVAYGADVDAKQQKSVTAKRGKAALQLALVRRKAFELMGVAGTSNKDRIAAMEMVIASIEQQAKLEGLHMPVKVAATTPDGERWAPLWAEKLRDLNDEQLKAVRMAASIKLLPAGVVDGDLKVGNDE